MISSCELDCFLIKFLLGCFRRVKIESSFKFDSFATDKIDFVSNELLLHAFVVFLQIRQVKVIVEKKIIKLVLDHFIVVFEILVVEFISSEKIFDEQS